MIGKGIFLVVAVLATVYLSANGQESRCRCACDVPCKPGTSVTQVYIYTCDTPMHDTVKSCKTATIGFRKKWLRYRGGVCLCAIWGQRN